MEQTLYYNGTILTMETPATVQAIRTENGVIRGLGSLEQMQSQAGAHARRVDLDGKTLLPAFIDSHSHISAFAETLGLASLAAADSFDALVAALSEFRIDRAVPDGEWIMGFGYDHTLLAERTHPDRRVLDAACPDHPVLIANASGHMGVANSMALRLLGITADTPDPDGGKIGRDPDGAPNGYLEENAFIRLTPATPPLTAEQAARDFVRAQNIYLSHGISTAQEGLVREAQFAALDTFAQSDAIRLDVLGYVDLDRCGAIFRDHPRYHRYSRHLRLGGYKIFLDGSPQGKTAWLTQPYEGESDDRGYPIHTDEALQRLVDTACEQGVQLLAHCNGDAAADQFLCALERANQRAPIAPLRPVMIHAQILRPDQLDRMKVLGVIPSFFVAHTYYWGDIHRENLGARADRISPAHDAVLRKMPFTLHQDTPVLPPDLLCAVGCAIHRRSRAGVSMGEAQRITPLDALRAITCHAAYQSFEEDQKGSLRVGKRADFAILNRDPLSCAPEDFSTIQVVETILRGESVYRRD